METTQYHSPTLITQISPSDESISWVNTDQIRSPDTTILYPTNSTQAGFFSTTTTEIYRVAMRDRIVRTNSVNQLWCTDFNFSNLSTVVGIELRLVTSRLARIQDYLISLIYNNQLVGDNKANDFAENDQIYGGEFDMWNSSLTTAEIESPSFGVAIGLGPHKKYPHSDIGYINSVQLKLYYGIFD